MFPVGHGPCPPFVGAGFIPPASVCGGANRADMESAPTGVCGIAGSAFSRVAMGLAPVRRGGIYPARGCSRRREVRGTMRASSPTEVCYNAGVWFPGWPRCSPWSVGGPWASRGRLRQHRGPRDDASIVPYRGLQHCRVRVFPVGRYASPCSVGRAFTPAAPPQIQKTCSGGHFFKDRPCGGVNPPPCRARQTLYRQETNAFLNRLTHPQNGWVFYARRRALVFRHGSR